jgi:hypothetical protein
MKKLLLILALLLSACGAPAKQTSLATAAAATQFSGVANVGGTQIQFSGQAQVVESTPTPELTAQVLPTNTPTNTPLPPTATRTAIPPTVGTPAAASYYVATTGSDSNPGTIDGPFRTIKKGVGILRAGYALYIRGGVYNEYIDTSISAGTATSPILIASYPGEVAILDGGGTLPPYPKALWSVNAGSYIIISGIEIRGSSADGLLIYGDHVTVENCYIHENNNNGLGLRGPYGIAQGNRIYRNGLVNKSGNVASYPEGLYTISKNVIIRNNTAWQNYGEGINVHLAYYVTVEDNTSYDNWSVNIYVSDSQNVLVQRNFVYNTGFFLTGARGGIMMGDEAYTPASANITIINNIAYRTNRNFYWWQGTKGGGMNNVLIANNTFVDSTGTAGVVIATGTHNNVRFLNNIVMQSDGLPVANINSLVVLGSNLWSKTSSRLGTGDIVGNPLFQMGTGTPLPEWFKLTTGSPAINKALVLPEVTVDFLNVLRSTTPTIGAWGK